MIVIVAPYSPLSRSSKPHLGGARKQEIIIEQLALLDPDIVIVNSAHNAENMQPFRIDKPQIGLVSVKEITLTILPSRKIGKLSNLMQVRCAVKAVLNMGLPKLIWLYNGYAFESLFALTVQRFVKCPIVLEFEDWHFSRNRGVNPKPYIDYLMWRYSANYINHVFAVNKFLAAKMKPYTENVALLPGIVPKRLKLLARRRQAFSGSSSEIKIGYFGNLAREKGADLLLRIIDDLPSGYSLQVTGAGELESRFKNKAKSYSERLCYHGKVSDDELYNLIEKCDVIINPHAPIVNMDNGVFPFKVIEAVASGRLLISTPLPGEGMESVLQGVHIVDFNHNALLDAVLSSKQTYYNTQKNIFDGAREARTLYGEQAFTSKVENIYNGG